VIKDTATARQADDLSSCLRVGAVRLAEVEGYSAYGSLSNMYAASPRITID